MQGGWFPNDFFLPAPCCFYKYFKFPLVAVLVLSNKFYFENFEPLKVSVHLCERF